MKKLFTALVVCLLAVEVNAKTWIVDVNGGGDFTTIPAALNASRTGDTIKVWPGEYRDQVDINKDVTIIGSGYENTKIIADVNPAVILNAGKIMWFTITSNTGTGVKVVGPSVLANCVMRSCQHHGVLISGNNAIVRNCVCAFNNYHGIRGEDVDHRSTVIYNCILYKNSMWGIYARQSGYPNSNRVSGCYNCAYGNGDGGIEGVDGGQGRLNTNPNFASDYDYRIPSTSPCWDAGKIDEIDLDYSRSDMGVYGGVDAPIYPVVIDVKLELNADSTVTIKATGKAPY